MPHFPPLFYIEFPCYLFDCNLQPNSILLFRVKICASFLTGVCYVSFTFILRFCFSIIETYKFLLMRISRIKLWFHIFYLHVIIFSRRCLIHFKCVKCFIPTPNDSFGLHLVVQLLQRLLCMVCVFYYLKIYLKLKMFF